MTEPKRYVFDLDGTLCSVSDGNYESAEPFLERIAIVNTLFMQGHRITINTARGMGRFNSNQEQAKNEFEELTKRQLNAWGIQYHELFLGKPSGDYYIDDKAVSDVDFFNI